MEVLKKKFNVRKVVKSVVENMFEECDNLVRDDNQQTLECLRSFQEVLKGKLAAVKALEDEITQLKQSR